MTVENQKSPPWGATIKLVVGLTLVAIAAGLLLYFRSVVTSLILAFIFSYLFHPLVEFVSEKTFIPWKVATALVFIILLLLFGGIIAALGVVIVQQLQSLVKVIQGFVANIPNIAENLSTQIQNFGFMSEFIDVNDLANRLIETLQPIVGQAGTIVRSIATGAAVSIYSILLVFLISYFIVADSHKITSISKFGDIPDYAYDFRRLGRELRRIWNVFLRGQLVIIVMVVFVNSIILSILGVRYSIGLALLTGMARFLPYIGPVITAVVMALATFFQPSNYFGLGPWQYTIMVVAIAYIVDMIFDNFVQPRFFGDVLGVHPAALLVVAIVAANLLGLVGLVLAAPVLATLQLIGKYIFRKMFDLDPWPEPEEEPERFEYPWTKWSREIWKWLKKQWHAIREWVKERRSGSH